MGGFYTAVENKEDKPIKVPLMDVFCFVLYTARQQES